MDCLIPLLPVPPLMPELLEDIGMHNTSRLTLYRSPDYLDSLSDHSIVELYRLDRHQIEYLQVLLHSELLPKKWKYGVLTPLQVILKALMYLATGSPLHVGFLCKH